MEQHVTSEVIEALESEDQYCSTKWQEFHGHGNTPNGRPYNERSIDEWVLYMYDYMREAVTQTTRGDETAALHTIRKVTNLGVNAMKQHGALKR